MSTLHTIDQSQPRQDTISPDLKPMPWLPAAGLVLAAIIGGGVIAYLIADSWADTQYHRLTAKDAAAVRLDAVRTALTVAAGLGAGVTLLLALRRQSITERAQQQTERAQRAIEEAQRLTQLAADRSHELAERDSQERRITDIYVAAVEQLGSDKAPVRLGGLYALERLGNDTPKLRQTITDVWCAYLRMPFVMPGVEDAQYPETSDDGSFVGHVTGQSSTEKLDHIHRSQELEVRLTAQALLAAHLRIVDDVGPEPKTYWRGPDQERMRLNLRAATLADVNFSNCHLGEAIFDHAQFHGYTNLAGAHFCQGATMSDAQFHAQIGLEGARFHEAAYLGWAQFHAEADLARVKFHEEVDLREVKFHADADLSMMELHADADLSGAEFRGDADLSGTKFYRGTDLSSAQFHRNASPFGAEFHGETDLSGAQFLGGPNLLEEAFEGEYLGKPQFSDEVQMVGALVSISNWLPAGWTISDEARSDGLLEVILDKA